MTPSARIKAGIDLLDKVLSARIPADGVAGDYFRFRTYIGSKDRAEIAERLYAMLRHLGRLRWWAEKMTIKPDARGLMILFLALAQKPTDVAELFDGTKYGPSALDETERTYLEQLKDEKLIHSDMPVAVRVECPPAHEERLQGVFGEKFENEMAALLTPAPLDVRVNLLKADREKVLRFFEADRVQAAPTRFSPWGLRLTNKTFLSKTKAFSQGFIDIQDEGSQLIALLCNPKPGSQVLDYCAGAGGKTLALAGMMDNKGRIVAMDTEPARLEKARPRFRRAGIHDIIEIRPLTDERHRKWLRRQNEGTFDVVLADVPCTGSGTWRRNPDMRWRTYGPKLEELQTIQQEILEKVSCAVKPGGRLVYATCSLFREENEDQVEAFLNTHPDFRLVPLSKAWPLHDVSPPCTGDYMRLSPLKHDTDGFFAAVMERKST